MSEKSKTVLAAILEIDRAVLAQLLNLPPDAQVFAVNTPIDRPHIVQLRVLGAGYPVIEGQVIPPAFGKIKAGDTRISWSFDQ